MLHLCMHRLKWRPDEVYNLPPETKKFIYESMSLQIEEENKSHEQQMKEIQRLRNKN